MVPVPPKKKDHDVFVVRCRLCGRILTRVRGPVVMDRPPECRFYGLRCMR